MIDTPSEPVEPCTISPPFFQTLSIEVDRELRREQSRKTGDIKN